MSPGMMATPASRPLSSIAVTVVAVPILKIRRGGLNSAAASTAPTTISEPTEAAFSTRILSPVLTPGPTVSGWTPKCLSTAVAAAVVTVGTTEQIIAPSTFSSAPYSRNADMIDAAISSAEARRTVENDEARSLFPDSES